MAAATTPTRPPTGKAPFRLSTMEVLGFIETPGSAMNSAITWVDTTAEQRPSARSAEVDADDPFAGWRPTELGRRFTNGRVRWSRVATAVTMMVLLAMGALWAYQRPQAQAEDARQEALDSVSDLQAGLGTLAEVNRTLTASTIDSIEVNTVMLSVDGAVRRVFAASAGLPSTFGQAKARLLDATGATAEALRLFGHAYTYRSTAIPLLAAPILEGDPGLVTLEQAAEVFSQWQARFESIRSTLPKGPLNETNSLLDSLSSTLPDVQRDYLDGLRTEDSTAMQDALDRLAQGLSAAESSLFHGLALVEDMVAGLLEGAGAGLEAVNSLLG